MDDAGSASNAAASPNAAANATTDPAAGPAPGFADHPGHTIDLEPCPERQRALFGDRVIADSERAILVREASYAPVIYFPRGDVNMGLLESTDRSSYCPFKGDASYWSIAGGGDSGENAAWSYQTPYDEMTALKDYIAFYPDRVTVGS